MRRSHTPILLAAAICLVLALGVVPSGGAAPGRVGLATRPASASTASLRVATIDPDGGKVKSTDPSATIGDFPDGNTIAITVADASAPRTYSVRVPLSAVESLVVLPAGGIAVTVPAPDDTDSGDDATIPPPDDQQGDTGVIVPLPEDPTDPTDNPDSGPVDTTDYPDGNSVAPARDGMAIVSDALEDANGSLVAAAVDPPSAIDAVGRAVPVTLSVVNDRVIVSIAPQTGVAFPIGINLVVGFDMDYEPATASMDTLSVKSTRAACGQDDGPKVVISYDGRGWQALATALALHAARCATYYILVPSSNGDNGGTPNIPHGGSPALIRAFNAKNTVGATFVPVSVLHYDKVGDPLVDGPKFTAALRAAHYATWAIDEAPPTLLTDQSPDWGRLVQLTSNLASNGQKGIVLNVYTPQGTPLSTLRGKKKDLKRLLSQLDAKPNFEWDALGAGTAYWADETYTQCSLVCMGGDRKLAAMGTRTNEYIQHTPRLAFAADAPDDVAAARDFLRTRYLPVTNGWWSRHGGDAYQTFGLKLPTMQGLVSLQVYAARAWMTADNPYSGSRIGIRWNGTPPAGYGQLKAAKAAQTSLANRFAAAVKGAYQAGGTARGACKSPKGAGGMSACQPSGGTAFTTSWSIFRAWGARAPQGGGGPVCPVWEGGPPANDAFSNAEVLDTSNLLGSHSVSSLFDGATVETSEPGVDAQHEPCTTVWYSLTAPRTDIYAIDTNVRFIPADVAPPFIAVWKGSAPGSLAPVTSAWNNGADDSGARMSSLSFNGIAGETYFIQVGNVPDQLDYSENFTIMWSRD